MAKKHNYLVTASFIKDKCRRVNTLSESMYHFTVGGFDCMHDGKEKALYVKTPNLGLLVSYVSYDAVKKHLDSGHLSESLIGNYLTSRGTTKSLDFWPARAEAARQWLLANVQF